MKESEINEKFKAYINGRGYKVVSEFTNSSPDLIIEKDGLKIAVEIKGSRNSSKFGPALGQLLFAKKKQNPDKLWLVISKLPSTASLEWVKLLWDYGISIFSHYGNEFVELTSDLIRPSKRSFYEIDERIFNFLNEHPDGLSSSEIIRRLSLEKETFEGHISGIGLKGIFVNKDKITIENGKIRLI